MAQPGVLVARQPPRLLRHSQPWRASPPPSSATHLSIGGPRSSLRRWGQPDAAECCRGVYRYRRVLTQTAT